MAAVSLSAGCAVGPDYARPQVPSPAQFRFVEGDAQAQALADSPWWRVFDDPALQTLVREALANNLDLQLAVARLEEARARAGVAKSYFYPQVDGGLTYAVRGASNTQAADGSSTDDTTHQSGSYGFQLSWEVDLFGRLRRQRSGAGADAGAGSPAAASGHAGRRRRVQLLSVARARSATRHRAQTLRLNNPGPSPISATGWTACRTARGRSHRGDAGGGMPPDAQRRSPSSGVRRCAQKTCRSRAICSGTGSAPPFPPACPRR
jgi:hypothetical protein